MFSDRWKHGGHRRINISIFLIGINITDTYLSLKNSFRSSIDRIGKESELLRIHDFEKTIIFSDS